MTELGREGVMQTMITRYSEEELREEMERRRKKEERRMAIIEWITFGCWVGVLIAQIVNLVVCLR